jgi:hypothetical protein
MRFISFFKVCLLPTNKYSRRVVRRNVPVERRRYHFSSVSHIYRSLSCKKGVQKELRNLPITLPS